MGRHMSAEARVELVRALGARYARAGRGEKARILDEFVSVTGYHRKHAIRALRRAGRRSGSEAEPRLGWRVYDEAVRQALIVAWEATDRLCGKRLKAALPGLLEAMERHGHLRIDSDLRRLVLSASAATIDRLLAPARAAAGGGRRRRRWSSTSVRAQVPVRTAADWCNPTPGYVEADFVAHCGGLMRGRFLHTLVLTDVATGWTECIALLTREQSLVVKALTLAAGQLPFPLKGFDTDNDSAFINEVVLDYCRRRGMEFTRSRPGPKNDQAWVEQKNGAVVRRAVGYERFEGVRAVDAMRRLFQSMRLFVNYFQPSFKLLKKEREGARVRKTYAPPATPCDRVLSSPHVSEERKSVLRQERANLDPIHLLKMMRDSQEELATLTNAQEVTAGETALTTDTDEFLAALPNL